MEGKPETEGGGGEFCPDVLYVRSNDTGSHGGSE
jgi:hypothetical protein